MGQTPFPAPLATLAEAQHKANADNPQGQAQGTPSTCQPWQQEHGQPWLDVEVLREAA